jgi:exosome complex component RRP45
LRQYLFGILSAESRSIAILRITTPVSQPPNMPREVEPSLNEKQFILKALDEGLRLDGRAFDQYRDIELTFGDEYGVADVRLGKTRSAPSPLPPPSQAPT